MCGILQFKSSRFSNRAWKLNWKFAHTAGDWIRDWFEERKKCFVYWLIRAILLLEVVCAEAIAGSVAANKLQKSNTKYKIDALLDEHCSYIVCVDYESKWNVEQTTSKIDGFNVSESWIQKLLEPVRRWRRRCCRFDPEYFHVFLAVLFIFVLIMFYCLQTKNGVFHSHSSSVFGAPRRWLIRCDQQHSTDMCFTSSALRALAQRPIIPNLKIAQHEITWFAFVLYFPFEFGLFLFCAIFFVCPINITLTYSTRPATKKSKSPYFWKRQLLRIISQRDTFDKNWRYEKKNIFERESIIANAHFVSKFKINSAY